MYWSAGPGGMGGWGRNGCRPLAPKTVKVSPSRMRAMRAGIFNEGSPFWSGLNVTHQTAKGGSLPGHGKGPGP